MHKVVTFESFGEFVAAADTQHTDKISHTGTEESFHGTATFGEAVELATKGWPEGADRIAKLRATLESVVQKTVTAKSSRLEWAESGDFLDVGRVLSGEPEAFGSYVESDATHGTARVIKIVGNVSARGGVKSESIFSAGAAVAAAVDVLELLGHRVELWLGSGSLHRSTDEKLTVLVKVKEASQPLDLDRVAFVLAHNASLRRLFFSVEEDLGFSPGITGTCPLRVDGDAVVTPEVCNEDSYSDKRVERVLRVCESCGISLTAEERASIVS